MLFDGFRLVENRAMRDETKLARFRLDTQLLEPTTQYVALDIESEMLAHAVARRLCVLRGTVAGASNVVDVEPSRGRISQTYSQKPRWRSCPLKAKASDVIGDDVVHLARVFVPEPRPAELFVRPPFGIVAGG